MVLREPVHKPKRVRDDCGGVTRRDARKHRPDRRGVVEGDDVTFLDQRRGLSCQRLFQRRQGAAAQADVKLAEMARDGSRAAPDALEHSLTGQGVEVAVNGHGAHRKPLGELFHLGDVVFLDVAHELAAPRRGC